MFGLLLQLYIQIFCFIRMSLLSTSQYSTVSQAVSLLKSQIQQQSHQQMSKFQLIDIKVKLIEEQTQEVKEKVSKYEQQTQASIDSLSKSTKNALKQILESHPKDIGQKQLEPEFKQLQKCRDKLIKQNKSLTKELAETLEAQIEQLSQKIKTKSAQKDSELKKIQNELIKQIAITRNKLKQNEELIDESENIERLEVMSKKISSEISKLKERRVDRKEGFLNLLEKIVVKCRQSNEQE